MCTSMGMEACVCTSMEVCVDKYMHMHIVVYIIFWNAYIQMYILKEDLKIPVTKLVLKIKYVFNNFEHTCTFQKFLLL